MNTKNLRDVLFHTDIDTQWKETLESFEEGSETDKSTLHQWVYRVRDEFIAHADDVGDEEEEELLISVALAYIEMKSQWQMLNTQINYQVFRKGEANMILTYKSSLLSVLVDAIGKFLSNEDLSKIHEFLLNPTADILS
ncbi:MAG: hypothetical protein MUF71_19900 [Candidatus Kapabacteria bacterium]|nr:hypothetical protein [Candidatus Kapabacteria bacterium]